MNVRDELIAQLSRYDDDTWTALANRGLLRRARKDLTTTIPELLAEDAAALTIQVGTATVHLDNHGPAQARCNCPSATTCQHIITASLWLLTTTVEKPTDEQAAEGAVQENAGGQERELLVVGVDELVGYAGRPGYRWALRFVDDLELEVDFRVEVGRQLLLTFSSPRVTFRFMGGGPAGLVADTKLAALEKYQVAAVLAYQRVSGVGPPRAEREERASAPHQLSGSRERLRAAVSQLLTDTVRLGIAHLSESVHQRYETLAVWAQGADYHRLARALRRLADHVELLLDRSARADEHRLLDEAALAYALVCALDQAEQPRLMGQARGRYDAVRRMDLIGLGAYPWRAASGYHGLTALFWWPGEKRFVAWTDARPESMPGFDPRRRYHGVAAWDGLTSMAAATGAEVRLSDARLSPSGRLSGAERTRATAVPLTGEEIAAVLPAVTRWADLVRKPRSLLDDPEPLADWSVLRPAAFRQPRFDPVHQSLRWEILDEQGETLTLVLPYTAGNAHAINRIESFTPDDLPPGTLLTAQLRPTPTGLSGEPMSLIHPANATPVDPLHFTATPPTQLPADDGDIAGALAGDVVGGAYSLVDEVPGLPMPVALEELRGWLVRRAERGTGAGSDGALVAELASRHRAVRDVGYGVFPLTVDPDPAVAILRSCYLLQQVTQVLNQHSAFVVRG